MKPLTLRTKLTLSYTITVSVLLSGFALIYYRVLSIGLDAQINQEVLDRTSGLRGYLHFEEGRPTFVYDSNDPDEVAFINTATRFYQIYEIRSGALLAGSDELRASGVQFRQSDIAQYAEKAPEFIDLHTDQGNIRLRNEIVQAQGNPCLLFVGVSLRSIEDTVGSFLRALGWLMPSGILLAAVASWFMAGKALEPVVALEQAAADIVVSRLDRRLPLRGTDDELDKLAKQFNETLERLEKAVGEMKQFTASISHELRTPLAILRGEAEVALMQGGSSENYRRVLSSQLEEFEKLARMINQLLTLARAESGEVEIEKDQVHISEMVQTVAADLEPVAASKNLTLSCACEPEVVVTGDRAWLERIVLNLIDNAIKFTRSGGHIVVGLAREGNSAMLEVRDDGIGIAPDALPHIFERFYRADPSRTNRAEGAGLGLSLVKWAVDQHRGSIDVESTLGQGTRFVVRFPA